MEKIARTKVETEVKPKLLDPQWAIVFTSPLLLFFIALTVGVPTWLGLQSAAAEHQRSDLHALKQRGDFSRCAVVSSSGAIMNRFNGEEIDDHSAVFRFNDAPTYGFTHRVGRKNTVRVMHGRESILSYAQTHSEHLDQNTTYLWLPEPGDTCDNGTAELLRLGVPADNIFKIDAHVLNLIADSLNELYSLRWHHMTDEHIRTNNSEFIPTTGALGLLLALSICDSTDAYDMTTSRLSRASNYHYYARLRNGRSVPMGYERKLTSGLLSADDNSWHETFAAERNLWMRLSSSPLRSLLETGKAAYKGFSDIDCGRAERPSMMS